MGQKEHYYHYCRRTRWYENNPKAATGGSNIQYSQDIGSVLNIRLPVILSNKTLKKYLKEWAWRGLTLIGRIQIIKPFAIPKLLYRVALISCKKTDFIKKINDLIFSFVWKGKDKVKRDALINSIENRSLKMPDIGSMIAAQRILCLKKYLDPYPSSWKFFLDYYLKNGKFFFQCDFDYTNLLIYLPEFYEECVRT